VKILDRYILKSLLITFTTVFVILFFIFILQGIWLFIAELAGKDLDAFLIVKFLLLYAPTVVPLVLPLSVLLASIMTFGSFAENYEFAAMKSSGISLKRAMRPLTFFVIVLSIVAFIFANNVIPKAQYNFINLRKSILQQKPSMAIAAGQFSPVGGYNIKVDKKYGENDNLLEGVVIHKVSNFGTGISVVIKAAHGELIGNEKSNFLQLVLYDGNYYEDIIPKKYEDRDRMPFAKSAFKKYIINFDLAPLNKGDVQEQEYANTNVMLNVNELKYTLDSLQLAKENDVKSFTENINQKFVVIERKQFQTTSYYRIDKEKLTKEATQNSKNIDSLNILDASLTLQENLIKDTLIIKNIENDVLAHFKLEDQKKVYEIAKSNTKNLQFSIDNTVREFKGKIKNINNHWLALYEKFVIAFGCLLMFFIGAPLGAIIRKGGLGLPIVFAVLIFITFHFINVFGKKLAQEDQIPVFLGAWMSSFILTPLAILLTYRATNDIGLIQFDSVFSSITNFFKKIKKNN
jgi:lipopolysaccharide export system permease protein